MIEKEVRYGSMFSQSSLSREHRSIPYLLLNHSDSQSIEFQHQSNTGRRSGAEGRIRSAHSTHTHWYAAAADRSVYIFVLVMKVRHLASTAGTTVLLVKKVHSVYTIRTDKKNPVECRLDRDRAQRCMISL